MSDFYEEQIGELTDHVETLEAENKEKDEENKILREALEKIDDLDYGDTNSDEFDQQQSTRFLVAKNIVTKVLEVKK